jgi:transmembrane sensor
LGPWWRAHRRSGAPFEIAAAALILAGAVYSVGNRSNVPAISEPEVTQERPVRDVVTGPGERARIVLSDDTEIRLAPASRLRIPLHDSGTTRELFLEGAALFTVTHDTLRPLIVRTPHAVVRDVGTVFGVRAYTGNPTEVVVSEGEVTVSRDSTSGTSASLRRGDLARVTSDGAITTAQGTNVDAFVERIVRRRFVFEGATLTEVVAQIEREFDVSVKIGSPTLTASRVRATLSDQSLTEAIDQLSTLLGATYTRDGKTITIRARPGAHPAKETGEAP